MAEAEELKAANKLQIKTNELQDTANTLQEKMISVIAKNNEETSKHNFWIRLLTILIVILTGVTVFSSINKTGRYAISAAGKAPIIIDTKTGEVWVRGGAQGTLSLGRNDKPKVKKFNHEKEKYEVTND